MPSSGQEIGRRELDLVGHAVTDRVLARELEGGRSMSVARIRTSSSIRLPPDGERHGDRPAPGPDVGDPDRRRAGRARRGRGAARTISSLGELDEPLGLRARDERPGVGREGQAEELLEPADVGDRLAGSRRVDGLPEAASAAPSPTGASGCAIDRRPVHARIARARSSSASSRAVSEPATRSRSMPTREELLDRGHRRGSAGLAGRGLDERGEPLRLVGRDERVDEPVELAVEDPGQVRQVHVRSRWSVTRSCGKL